jgi:hypothetical protein
MAGAIQTRFTLVSLGARSVLCLLLAVLFLYNPYMTAPGTPGKLSVAHQTSYRATLAASELQQFSAPDGPVDTVFAEAWLDAFQPDCNDLAFAFVHPTNDAFSHLQFLCASLWFRPPPVA